jgi:hypothetical protein
MMAVWELKIIMNDHQKKTFLPGQPLQTLAVLVKSWMGLKTPNAKSGLFM